MAESLDGALTPRAHTVVGGSDGTNARVLKVTADGEVAVVNPDGSTIGGGGAAEGTPGSAPPTKVIVIGGWDTTNVRRVVTDANGILKIDLAGVDGGVTVPVETASTSKGYQQLTSTAASATIASLCSGAALPSGATKALIVPTAAVRFRDDATNPSSTVGFPVAASQPYTYDGDLLSALKVFGAATLDVWFYA